MADLSENTSPAAPDPIDVFAELRQPALSALTGSIDAEVGRYRKIVRGQIRKELRKFMSEGELIGKEGKDLVRIPLPRIDIPHFKHGSNQGEGVGQGDGDGQGQGQPGSGQRGKGGEGEGQHMRDEVITLDELADIMAEELQLPRIKPKGTASIENEASKYNKIRRVGPNSLRHMRRSFKRGLLRTIASGEYDPEHPVVVPIREDFRFRAASTVPKLVTNAAIVYVMDVSGSMTDEHKRIAQQTAFWIDLWLDRCYKGCQRAYIVHDFSAKQVDRQTFYTLRVDGGTKISSGLEEAKKVFTHLFPPDQYNLYLFHFSDGDNSSYSDSRTCVKLLRDDILPMVNLYGYMQIDLHGRGDFLGEIRGELKDRPEVVLQSIGSRDRIMDMIKGFLGLKRLQEQRAGESPQNVSHSPRPLCYSKCPAQKQEYRRHLRIRRARYREASFRYRLGDYTASFPEHCYRPPTHRASRLHPFTPLSPEFLARCA